MAHLTPPPSLPLNALPTPGPRPWCALPCLPPCPCLVFLPLSPAPLPFPQPLTPVPFPCPCLCPSTCPASLLLLPAPLPVPCACPPPLPLALCPCPCPLPCPVSLLPLPVPLPVPCACPPLLPQAVAPCPCPCCLLLPRTPWPFPCVRPLAPLCLRPPRVPALFLRLLPQPPLSSASRPAPPGLPPPFLDPAPPQLRQRDAPRRALGRRGADGLRNPFWEGYLGGLRLSVAGVGVAGIGVGAVFGALPALRCGRGSPWRSARSLCGARARAGHVRGADAWLVGAAAAAPCASRALPGGGPVGAAVWAAGAASRAWAGSRAGGSGSLGAAWGCLAGSPTGTTASASCRSSRCAGVSPAHPGETGERERAGGGSGCPAGGSHQSQTSRLSW